jgi:hypothetical protein
LWNDNCLARRAEHLSTQLPAPHFPSEFGDEIILFDSGFAAPQLLPDLSGFAADALTTHREEVLQYASGRGQPYLREWLANWMNEDGCALTADHILITNGAKQGIDLTCRLLLDDGDAIVVTAPTYFTAIPIFRNHGAEFVEIAQDDAGLDVAALEAALDARAAAGRASVTEPSSDSYTTGRACPRFSTTACTAPTTVSGSSGEGPREAIRAAPSCRASERTCATTRGDPRCSAALRAHSRARRLWSDPSTPTTTGGSDAVLTSPRGEALMRESLPRPAPRHTRQGVPRRGETIRRSGCGPAPRRAP